MLGICRDLDNAIARRDGEFIPRRGFMEIRERDDPGSVPRDARWRGGRRRKDSAKPTVYLITATALAQADAFGKSPHLHSHEVNERLIPMVYLSDRMRSLAATGCAQGA